MKKTFLFLTAALAVGASLFLAQPAAHGQAAYMGKAGTVTAAAGAATLDSQAGIVTTESLTTAAAANYTLTLTNNKVTSAAHVLVVVTNGTNTTVGATLWTVTPGSGSVVIVVKNEHASVALNGTLKIWYQIYNP
jgi:hypothetical protein